MTSDKILQSVSRYREERKKWEYLRDQALAANDRPAVNYAALKIDEATAAMRAESKFASLYMSADENNPVPIMFYTGLPVHYVAFSDAMEAAAKKLSGSLAVSRFCFGGPFAVFIEVTNGSNRTFIDLLHPTSSNLTDEELGKYFGNRKGNYQIKSPKFDEGQNIILSEPCPSVRTEKKISGVPDYQCEKSRGCAPAAAGCVLGYWDDRGYPNLVDGGNSNYRGTEGVDGYLNLIWNELANAMGYVIGVGTYTHLIAPGIKTVTNTINGYNFSTSNKYYSNPANDRSAYWTEIDATRPLVYCIQHPLYGGGAGGHAVTGIGYKRLIYDEPCSGIYYYRIVHDNNTTTGIDVYLNEADIIGGTNIITVRPGVAKKGYSEERPSPDQYILKLTNYPNPCNPVTTLSFEISKESKVELSIFNYLGEKVRSFQIGTLGVGRHSLQWDGNDEFGNNMPSGVYFAELNVEGKTLLHKIVLVR
ncbi:MAG: T9SS type A sorting domain-containing protein [candidate division KSB1 bacterium]|nr:T9SS type A sorting domain-containing protein [candidate division KSB1 bacterium]